MITLIKASQPGRIQHDGLQQDDVREPGAFDKEGLRGSQMVKRPKAQDGVEPAQRGRVPVIQIHNGSLPARVPFPQNLDELFTGVDADNAATGCLEDFS